MARTAQTDDSTDARKLYMAMELSKGTWKLGFATELGQKPRIVDVRGQERRHAVLAAIEGAKRRFRLPADAPVVSCYEAGRDGFWIHRWLTSEGVQNLVLEPASLEVDRRRRRAKTDGIDVRKMLRHLIRHNEGDLAMRIVRVPPAEAEDERLLPRRLKSLKERRTQLTNQIRAVLFQHGIDLNPRRRDFAAKVAEARQWNGEPLLPGVQLELDLLRAQLELIERQIGQLQREHDARLKAGREAAPAATPAQKKAALLAELKGIGETGAYVLTTEFFGWRKFDNRKQVGALAGLTGTPFDSGNSDREQGISKSGNKRVRALLVQQAWGWLRWQPTSELSRWFWRHVGQGGSRNKRKAIVALARKLLIALWHFVEHGVVPDGAVLKAEAAETPDTAKKAAA